MKKFLLSLLSTILSLSLLAGCSGPQQSGAAGEPDSTVPPGPAFPKEDVVLQYWSMWEADEPQGQVIASAADAFYRETGIKVTISFQGQDQDRLEHLKAALAQGTTVDIFDDKMEALVRELGPNLLSLGQMTMQYDYIKTAGPELLKAARGLSDGDLLCIPYQPYAMVFFYNDAIFRSAGIDAPPTTWDEFLEVCQQLKTAGYIPIACDDAFIDLLIGHHIGRLVGQWELQNIIRRGTWDTPAVRRFAEDYATLARRGYFSPTVDTNVWPYSQNNELATGKAAMYFTGSWLPHDLIPITGPDFGWRAFPYPVLEGGEYGLDTLNYSAMALGINKATKHQAESFQFIQFLTKGTFDSMLSEASHSMPVDRSNSAWPKEVADLRPVFRNIKQHWVWGAGVECAPEITPIIIKNTQLLCAGLLTADEFVAAMERDTAGIVVEDPWNIKD